jgi:hypothetical protein
VFDDVTFGSGTGSGVLLRRSSLLVSSRMVEKMSCISCSWLLSRSSTFAGETGIEFEDESFASFVVVAISVGLAFFGVYVSMSG